MQADLAQYRWHNRLLITFAPTLVAAERQTRLFAHDPAGRRDRQILRIVVLPSSTMVEARASKLDSAALRRRYRVRKAEFRTLLVGKDGTVAYSTRRPVPLRAIFARIDAMPMRRDEVQKRTKP